jgi:hypothetical protein
MQYTGIKGLSFRGEMMNPEKVADMTIDELSEFVGEMIERRIMNYYKPQDDRTVAEILADIDKHRWTPPPGAKSSLELLREDRDA